MGREVRLVPPDWQHPRYTEDSAPFPEAVGRYIPMLDRRHADAVAEWETVGLPGWIEGERLWRIHEKVQTLDGETWTIAEAVANANKWSIPPEFPDYKWWAGECPSRPSSERYMPAWSTEQRTHLMMYEDVSEGTPISPAFETPEELARWLADSGASAFAGLTATYEQWLATIIRGRCPFSAVMVDGRFLSGVEFTGGT